MLGIFIALLIFIGVYAVVKFLLSLVPPVSSLAEVLGIVIGIIAALIYTGAIR